MAVWFRGRPGIVDQCRFSCINYKFADMPKAGILLQGHYIYFDENMIFGKIGKSYRGPNCETGFYNQQ